MTLHSSRLVSGECRTRKTDFYTPVARVNPASPAAVANGGVQPILIRAEGSATSEPDSRS